MQKHMNLNSEILKNNAGMHKIISLLQYENMKKCMMAGTMSSAPG